MMTERKGQQGKVMKDGEQIRRKAERKWLKGRKREVM